MREGPAGSRVNGTATGKSQGAGEGSLVRTKENSLTCLLCVLRDDPQHRTNSVKTRSGTGAKATVQRDTGKNQVRMRKSLETKQNHGPL